MKHGDRQSGFVVLTSVIVLSVVLLLLAQTLSIAGYFQGSGALNFELKERSYALAYTCIDSAFYKISQDLDYAGNETLTIGSGTCHIDTIVYQNNQSTITSSATYGNNTTRLKLVGDANFAIVSFQEL